MRAVAYIRVSTLEQSEHGISLADQEHRIREFIAARGWECVEVFSDRGVSGSVPFAHRPAGAQAFAADVDRIVVVAWDRLGRDAADFLAVVRDREVVSITEDGEPSLLRDLRAVLAQEERRKIIERTKAAAQALARDGRYNGPRPLGYRFAGGLLEPVPEEAELIRRIFAEFVAGRTQTDIARDLNHDAIKTVRGGRWRQGSIRCLLANPLPRRRQPMAKKPQRYRVEFSRNEPYRCPVCHGRGWVPPDFYAGLGSGTSTANEPCRPCDATGIVWSPLLPTPAEEDG